MREYIRTLDHCPFCKEKLKFKHRKSKDPKDNCIGLCHTDHNFKNKEMAIWVYGSSLTEINNCFLGIRIWLDSKKYNFLQISFYLGKNRVRTKISDLLDDGRTMRSSVDLSFDKLISFDFNSEEDFKKKLYGLIALS